MATLSRICRKLADDPDGADGADAIWSRRWRRNNADWGRAAAVARHHSIEVELIESSPATHLERGGGDADC